MDAPILLVEDTPHNMDLMRYLLHAGGYTTAEATNGAEALEVAARTSPALVLLDIHLPDIGGLEVLRRLRDEIGLSGVPIVAVTALAMVGDRDAMLAAGFDGYLAKPLEPRTFVSEVAAYLDRPAAPHPPAPAPAGPATVRHRPAGPCSGTTVLVVDNLPPNRQFACTALLGAGFAVVAASGAAEARALLEHTQPDLILCDLHMPGGNGSELLDYIKRDPRFAQTPFVFLTSSSHWDQFGGLQGLGAADVILRPIEPELLVQRVAAVLGCPEGLLDEDR